MSDHTDTNLPDEVEEEIRRDAAIKELTPASVIGRYDELDPSDLAAVRTILEDGTNLQNGDGRGMLVSDSPDVDEDGGVSSDEESVEAADTDDHHVEIDSARITEHYDRVRPVYEQLGTVGENPTMGLDDLAGWYVTRDETRVDRLEDGYTKRRRPASFERDLDRVLDRVDRTVYGLTTYKDPGAFRRWTPARFDEEAGAYEHKGGSNPTPEPEDLRAVSVWGDIDLCDHLKTERGQLDDETRQTAEATLEAYAEEFGQLVGGTDAVYALDSVGGAYIFTAPEATLPIAEYVAEEYDEDRAGTVLREVIDRSNEWLKDAQERVEERVEGAADVIDPDWANNHNRKYKAPLSIHKDHDAVVTPMDPDDVDYQITRIDDVDEDTVAEGEAWASQFTALEYTDRVSDLVEELFTDEFEDVNTWQAAVDAHVEAEIGAERRREELEQARQQSQERDRDLDLSGFDITPSIDDVKDAIEGVDVEAVADDTIVKLWTERESGLTDRSGSGKKAIVPSWAGSYNSGNATYIDLQKGIFNDTDSGDYGTVVEMALIDDGGWNVGDIARGDDWARGVQLLRERGYDIPVWTPDAKATSRDQMPYWALRDAAIALGTLDEDDLVERDGKDGGSYRGFPDAATYNAALEAVEDAGLVTGRDPVDEQHDGHGDATDHFPIVECEPPQRDPVEIDVDELREDLTGDQFDAVLEDDQLHLWSHDPGAGKTTSAALAAFDRDEPHVPYFPNHEKARDHITDDVLPGEEYFPLKGAEQPKNDCCLDASVDAEHNETPECPNHGHPSEWPRMCPVYELGSDHAVRERFDRLVPEVGVEKAHRILDLCDLEEHRWHPEKCRWQAQYSSLENEDHVAAVHPYITQSMVRDDRVNIVDEAASLSGESRRFSVEQLTRLENTLTKISGLRKASARDDPVVFTCRRLASFIRDIVDIIIDSDTADELDQLEPPTPIWNAYESYDDAAGNYVESEEAEEPWQHAEAFAKTKIAVGEHVLRQMKKDEWDGTPLSIDPILAAASVADDDPDIEAAIMKAIALPAILDSCPWCNSELAADNGARMCYSDSCDWDEREHMLTQKDGERARALAWMGTNARDAPAELAYRTKPLASQLPDPGETLVLDATGDREAVAARFDVDREKVEVAGNEPLALPNARVMQVADGQYHKSTISDSDTAQERIQNVIDTAGDVYQHPLFVLENKLLDADLFEFPDNATVRHYHAVRGLNLTDCDAVIPIGAPHPDVEDLEREAELLAMGRDDVRVGGEEHSTRRDETGTIAENPPVYRKLNYTDENGKGRAVPTKHYSGLVGALFRERREHELLQAVHRARPLLAGSDDPVDIIMLTNVPTRLEIDELVSFDELSDPLRAMFPVPEGAVELLEAVDDVVNGNGPSGFRPRALVEIHSDGTVTNKVDGFHRLAGLAGVTTRGSNNPPSRRTVYNWVNALEDVGLLVAEKYEQQAGVSYAADPATLQSALSVLSRNGGFKVAALRRFRKLTQAADGSLEWLRWAREAFDLTGELCEWDPPDHAPS